MIDWLSCPVVERTPGMISGAWRFVGTRVPVSAFFEHLEDGVAGGDFVALFPGVTLNQVKQALEHAAASLETP